MRSTPRDPLSVVAQSPQLRGARTCLHCVRIAGGTGVFAAMLGGVMNGGFWKSNISSGGNAFASRAVSAGRPNRVSMNRVIDAWSWTRCDTKCARA